MKSVLLAIAIGMLAGQFAMLGGASLLKIVALAGIASFTTYLICVVIGADEQ